MNFRINILISVLFWINSNIFGLQYDSLFIDSTKKFANKEFGVILNSGLYTKWSETNDAKFLLYVSLPNRVQDAKNTFIIDESKPKKEQYDKLGFTTFEYEFYCDASTLLKEKFLSFSFESISFIMFHELLHNYFIQEKIQLPKELNEAACDVIGNYCTLKYVKYNKRLQKKNVKQMIEANEKTYEIMNKYILRINQETEDASDLCDQCNSELYLLSKTYDDFQRIRFYSAVNTAYLLKNSDYSINYFLLKSILLKVKNIKEFLLILRHCPENKKDYEKYLAKHK